MGCGGCAYSQSKKKGGENGLRVGVCVCVFSSHLRPHGLLCALRRVELLAHLLELIESPLELLLPSLDLSADGRWLRGVSRGGSAGGVRRGVGRWGWTAGLGFKVG